MKRRIRFRFFVILLGIAGIFAFIYFYHPPSDEGGYFFVERGEIILRDQGDALIIRGEKIYELPKHGRAEFSVIEGDWVEQGEPLALLFALGYDKQLIYDLQQVQERIFTYQRENIVSDILDSDISGLQTEINETIMDIQVYLRDGTLNYLGSKERDLRVLLEERQEILDKTVVPDQYLIDLYQQEAEIINKLGKSMLEVEAPASGIVSFSSDGLEEVLNAEAVAYATVNDIDALIRQRRILADRQSEDRIPFIRLVVQNKWFVACVITDSDVFYSAGDEIDLRFFENYERLFNGRISKISRSNKSTLVVIEIIEDVQAVFNTRTARIEISKKKSGLMVPKGALITQNGVDGLKVAYGSSFLFAPVEVLAFGDKYAIIEDVEDAVDVDIGTRVILE